MNMRRKFIVTSLALAASLTLAGSAFAYSPSAVNHADWMAGKGIVQGYGYGDLALNRSITVAEALALIARTQGLEVESKPGNWSNGYMHWAHSQGAVSQAELTSGNKTADAAQLKRIAEKLGLKVALPAAGKVTRGQFLQALGAAVTTHVTIAHTNDVHGHIQEDSFNKEFGYAKIATLISEWRKENPNFFLMDAGDTFQGTIYANQFQGEALLPILNALEYDLMAAGNHEFDFGYEQLLKLRDQLDYPMVNANVFKADGTNLLIPTYTVKVGEKTFAVLGLVTEETPIVTHPKNVVGLTFKDPVDIAKDLVPKLKKDADHVIVVSHVGLEVDREIARSVQGVDLIIGGHSHTPVRTPEKVNGTYIVQDWEYGKSLGRVDLTYYRDELVHFDGGLVEYDETVQADPKIDKLVQDVLKKVDESMNVVIAKTEVDLIGDRKFIRAGETNLANYITDALLAKTQGFKGHEADVALMNGGGFRAGKAKGEITKKDLYTILPFPNTLVVLEATGADIVQALENGIRGVDKTDDLPGGFPQIAGMSFSYDAGKPVGSRVLEVKVGGKPIDPKAVYKVATNDFLAVGGDGYDSLKKSSFFNSGLTLYDVVEERLMQDKTISPATDGRITSVK
ncbi:5'-nucleotidase [Cohnella sp. SGD-V74]|nr:5'-nucleotidase [Cohnella sp. SGD-V74]